MRKYFQSLCFVFGVLSVLTVVSCEKSDSDGGDKEPVVVSDGMFVLNEGNFYSQINGSLSYIDYGSKKLTDGLFALANGRTLGGTPNDMVLSDGKLVICCTDENRVEVVNARTFMSLASYQVSQPRCVCADGNGFYVSSYDGTVSYFSFDGKQQRQSAVLGGCLEGIAMMGGNVYVCDAYNADYTYNSSVVKLAPSTLDKVATITVACNPTALKSCGDKLYVLSSGNYADVQSQVQVVDGNGVVNHVCDATFFDVDDKSTVYAINAVTDWSTGVTRAEYFSVDTNGNRKTLVGDDLSQQIFSPCCIAVDPLAQMLFVSSYKQGATGYADYAAGGEVFQIDMTGNLVARYDAGVGPCAMVCNKAVR